MARLPRLQLDTSWGDPRRDIAIGLLAALVLAAIELRAAGARARQLDRDGVRAVYHELLVPLFARLSRPGIVLIGIAAGIGEEWLFRGVVQPPLGLVPASVLFGLAHVGGRRMLPFGVWATAMGLVLGGLAIVDRRADRADRGARRLRHPGAGVHRRGAQQE